MLCMSPLGVFGACELSVLPIDPLLEIETLVSRLALTRLVADRAQRPGVVNREID